MAGICKVKLKMNGVDVTDIVSNYLLSLSYTDCETGEADDLKIRLQDRGQEWLKSWIEQAVKLDSSTSSDILEGPAVSAKEVTGEAIYSSTNYVVNKGGAKMRDGAGEEYDSFGSLPSGTKVTVKKKIGNWYAVTQKGETVYINASCLSPVQIGTKSVATSSTGVTNTSTVDVSSYPLLKFGSSGDFVKIMQNRLIVKGQALPKYGVDGYFGSETRNAVKAFQQAVGITVDGICGVITWTELFRGDSSENTDSSESKNFYISASIELNDGTNNTELNCGQFQLDSVIASGPPSVIEFSATALPFSAQIRQTKKDRVWENTTLAAVAGQMATECGMSLMYDANLNPTFSRVEQDSESDIEVLNRLSSNSGLYLKVTDNMIVIFDPTKYEALASALTLTFGGGNVKTYKLATSECDTQYASCHVAYTSPTTGELIEGYARVSDYDIESDTNQQLEVREAVSSAAEAQSLAKTKLKLRNQYSRTAEFTLVGNTALVAGVCVDLSGWGFWDGKYNIRKATHTISASSGYITTISLQHVLEY